MAFDFPSSPTTGQTYSVTGGPTYVYNGTAWVVLTPGNQFNRTVFTATAGQTTFSMNYVVGAIDVYRNGVKMAPADFTATNGTSIVLLNAATVDDTIEVISYPMITYSDAVRRTGDTMTGNLTVPAVVMQTPFAFRNKIINGAMEIDQRNSGSAVTGTGTFSVDRWLHASLSTATYTRQLIAGGAAFPAYFLRRTIGTADTSLAASDYEWLALQRIEGLNVTDLLWGTASAKPVTVSFWVRSSLAGTFSVSLAAVGASTQYIFQNVTINSANTWEYKTLTFLGNTGVSIAANNTTALVLFFVGAAGSDYRGTPNAWTSSIHLASSSNSNFIGTNGATFDLAEVQLEVGSAATPFERRPYGLELALCQRYYTSSGGFSEYHVVPAPNATFLGVYRIDMPVPMRTDPTLTPNYITSNAISAYGWYTMNRNYSVHYITASTSTNAYMFFTWTASAEL